MKIKLAPLLRIMALTGCTEAISYTVMLPFVPVAMAFEAAETNGSIVQPLTVLASNGTVLVGPKSPGQDAVGVVTVSSQTTRCEGSSTSATDVDESVRFPVRCSNGQRRIVEIAPIRPSLTGASAMSFSLGRDEVPSFMCNGNFYPTGERDGPFKTVFGEVEVKWIDDEKTRRRGKKVALRDGAAAVSGSASDTFDVTVWFPKGP